MLFCDNIKCIYLFQLKVTVENDCAELKERVNSYEMQLKSSKEIHRILSFENAKAQSSLTTATAEVSRLRKQIKEMETSGDALSAKVSSLKNDISMKDNELMEYKQKWNKDEVFIYIMI